VRNALAIGPRSAIDLFEHDDARSFNAPQRGPGMARRRTISDSNRAAGPRERRCIHDYSLTKSFPQETPPVTTALPDKKRILIVGGGFAGIAAARALERAIAFDHEHRLRRGRPRSDKHLGAVGPTAWKNA
jgi:NADPH-dependent 2,4-dienoyl-CoA reductase/sulfur reductase-like enzyme